MGDDFILPVIMCFAEIITSDVPDKVRGLRFNALRELQAYLLHYQKLGYMPKLLCAIAEKKCERIKAIATKAEMERLIKPRCPRYDGNRFVPDEDIIPEEEAICWSEASLRAPLNAAARARYMELVQLIFPEEQIEQIIRTVQMKKESI